MKCIDAIMSRRSIRSYTTEAVSDADVDTIIRAAMAAPSAFNQQPWRFVVVRDAETRMRLSETSQYSGMLAEAPVGIVICADSTTVRVEGYWVLDCAAATENALLAVHALGLGGVWLGVHGYPERVANVRSACALPEHIEPVAMIALGHPDERKPAANRYREDFVHHERW